MSPNSAVNSAATRLPHFILAALAAAIGNALILIRTANVSPPLYASDEISYWHSARALFARVDSAAFNPYFPRVNCDLFYLMVGWLAQQPDGALAMRLFNCMMLVLTALLVYGAARSIMPRSWSVVAAALVFITGPSVWLVSTMPETAYAFFFALLAFVIVRFWSPGAAGISLLTGGLTGALMLVKPHGIAVALACIATTLAAPLVIHRSTRALRVAVIDLLMLAAGILVAIAAISSIARGELVLTPSKLIGPFYGNILSGSNPRSLARLLESARYYLVHMAVLAMFFAPAVVYFISFMAKALRADKPIAVGQQRTIVLLIFVAFCTVSVFAMVAVFTEAVAFTTEFERFRIHGRYWTFLMPWLAMIAFAWFNSTDGAVRIAWLDWAVGLVGLVAAFLFTLVISRKFSLYPWDFPELFALYRPDLQKWGMTLTWVPHGFAISISALLLSSVAFLLGFRWRSMVYAAALVTVFTVGNINTTQWQIVSAHGGLPQVASGIAARRIVGEQSEGALVGASYWGSTLYNLAYNLPLRSHVMQKPVGSALTDADLPPRTQWVMTTGTYDIQFSYRHVLSLPAATLYLRGDPKAP